MDGLQRVQAATAMMALCGAMGLYPVDTRAADIYRWVDEAGRTHLSDTVPEQYRATAQRYDTQPYEQTEEQKRQAAISSSRAANALKETPPSTPDASPATNAPAKPQPLDPNTADCAALRQQYQQAQECYEPYRTRTGIRAEAFQNCPQVSDPSPRCGFTPNY